VDAQQPVKLPSPTGGMVSSSLTSGTNGRRPVAAAPCFIVRDDAAADLPRCVAPFR